MKSFSIMNGSLYGSLLLVCIGLVAVTIAQQQQDKYKLKGDYLDVPVRSGYRIMGNDKDGYLEDGIIVKTKGTGYIDSRYRKRYETQLSSKQLPQDYHPQASYQFPRYATAEIIYGRRDW